MQPARAGSAHTHMEQIKAASLWSTAVATWTSTGLVDLLVPQQESWNPQPLDTSRLTKLFQFNSQNVVFSFLSVKRYLCCGRRSRHTITITRNPRGKSGKLHNSPGLVFVHICHT